MTEKKKETFIEFGDNAARAISMRKAELPSTEMSEILKEDRIEGKDLITLYILMKSDFI